MLLNWKSIFIGISLAIMLNIVLKIVFGIIGSFFSVIIASAVVCYTSNKDLTNGVVYGGLIGAIGGVTLEIFTLIAITTIGETIYPLITLGKATNIESIIIWTGLGIMGGSIGAMITNRSPEMEIIRNNASKVALNIENIQKCACFQCQVQAESKCVQNKMYMLKEMMKIEKDIIPEPENIPKMYCATGIAACSDINTDKICNCPNCEVFKENKLTYGEKTDHFCIN